MKYVGQATLQKVELREIVESMFPEAPELDKLRAIMLCASYGLNPLNKHVFLIPFKDKQTGDITWATVMGIKAKRLLASRRGPFSYMDGTPRVMTAEEKMAVFGEVHTDRLWVITKLRDPQSGAEAVGYGFWAANETIRGENKGNSKFNMASIRSESQALDRLRPGEMPQGIEAVDETIDAEYTVQQVNPSKTPKTEEKTGDSPAGHITESSDKGGGATGLSSTEGERDYDKKMIYAAAGKLGWDVKRLLKEIRERFGVEIKTIPAGDIIGSIPALDTIPADKFHEIANKLSDLAECT